MCACTRPIAASTSAWSNTRPANLPGLEPAQLKMQIPLLAQPGRRPRARAGGSADRSPASTRATGRDPSPRTRCPRAAIAATSARRAGSRPHHGACGVTILRTSSIGSVSRASAALNSGGQRVRCPASSPTAARSASLNPGWRSYAVGAQRQHPHRPRPILQAFCRQRGHASASPICAIRSRMDLRHPAAQAARRGHGRTGGCSAGSCPSAMPGERRDLMELPARPREIGQTQMSERVRAERRDTRAHRDRPDHLRPRPRRDPCTAVPRRLRHEQRPARRVICRR